MARRFTSAAVVIYCCLRAFPTGNLQSNAIRWRFGKDKDGNIQHDKKESNARMIKWSDGSESLAIGDMVGPGKSKAALAAEPARNAAGRR